MPKRPLSSAALKRSIYLVVLPVGGIAALTVGITGSFDASRSTANWLIAAIVGVVLLAATAIIAAYPRVSQTVERVLVTTAVVAYAITLVIAVAFSLRPVGGHIDGVIRIALWTAAIAGFTHLAVPPRLAGLVSWGLWTLLAVASGAVLANDATATIGERTTLIEALLVQGCALVMISGIVRVTGSERERASTMAKLATRDALTGLVNRRGAEERLQEEVDRAHRYGHPVSIAWFDLDHFKRVNDLYGHEVGDRVLRTIAMVARRAVRTHDTVGRWGGEEFVVILPQQGEADAVRTADRLRRTIAGRDLHLTGGERVTASFGVAELAPNESATHLLRRADQAVYAAKDGGRDRVIVAATPAPANESSTA